MSVFERTKELAKKRGMNLQAVAELAGLSKNAIYQWRKDYQPREVTVKAVADVLGVSVDYLLGNTDEMHLTKKNPDNVIDLREVSDDERYDMVSAGGRPITDEDWAIIKAILAKYPKHADEE